MSLGIIGSTKILTLAIAPFLFEDLCLFVSVGVLREFAVELDIHMHAFGSRFINKF